MTEIVIFAKQDRIPDPAWTTQASEKSYRAVKERLGPEAASALRAARVTWKPAARVLADANRHPLPRGDPDVESHIRKIRAGLPFAPVVVSGHTVVDGEHRLSVSYHHHPGTPVPVLELKGTEMPKKRTKIKKSTDRSNNVSDVREYSSLADADEAAASHVYDRPDEADLNDEVAEIRRENPGIGRFAAHVQATRTLRAQTQKADDPVNPVYKLADSLSEAHIAARRAGLNPGQRSKLSKASRQAELQYLREVRPWSVVEETQVSKAEGDDALLAKAAVLRKADPGLSEYQALRKAAAA